MLVLASEHAGWVVGFTIGIAIVVVVVALVVPILVLAHRIGRQARLIDAGLAEAVDNTAALADLATTNTMAVNVIQGLERGRRRLGG
jgi:Flp pilus assembly protein TadB